MEKTHPTNYPRYNYHKDCFANINGHCDCLTDTDFCDDECPFYKKKADIAMDQTIRVEEYSF